MSVRAYALVVGILVLSLTSAGHRTKAADIGCGQALKGDARELRGRLGLGHDVKEDCGGPAKGEGEKETILAEKKVKEGKKLKIDETGSPTNTEMDQIEKATKKTTAGLTSKIYQWPLYLRLMVVGSILLMPLLGLIVCIRVTPTEDLGESVYIKTALHCSFSFTVGWLNCIMLLRYRVFATMMVGNTILMGVAFVCNGGLKTAKEFGWSSEKVEAICPAQFENASHYLIMIVLFWSGAFIHGLLHKKFGWASREFAPVIAAGIILVEIMEYYDKVQDSTFDVYLLSPIFGLFVSISAHCGVGSVPWCATGHMTSMGYKFAAWCVNPFSESSKPYLRSSVVNMCLWISFVLGIMMGALFHSNRTVMLNALYLAGILIINDYVNSATNKEGLESNGMPRPESTPSVGDGSESPQQPKDCTIIQK